MAVIQPYMKPRQYQGLDVFTNYWASYTGARSAKWEQRMKLALSALDESGLNDLVDDLKGRRDDLLKEQSRLRRSQIRSVEEQERDTRRTSVRSTINSSALNQYVGRVGEYDKYNASAKERYDERQRKVDEQLLKEEREKTSETADFYKLIQTSQYGSASANQAKGKSQQAAATIYLQLLRGMEGRNRGTSEAAIREKDAHALALYASALEGGHTLAAQTIADEYAGFLGVSPQAVLDNRTFTIEELAEERERRLDAVGDPVGVDTDSIYDRAREQYRKEFPTEAAGVEAQEPAATTTPSAFDLYGAEQKALAAQISVLDSQILAAELASKSEKTRGMNAIQQMMSQNWNFAPYALAPDQDAQDFIDQVAEYDPLRVGTYMENVEQYGTPARLMRAQERGEVDPYDPITTTSVREYGAVDQGAFIFGHLHDEAQGIEQLLSAPGGEEKLVEAYAKTLALSGQAGQIYSFGQLSDPFKFKMTPFAKAVAALRQEDSALTKRVMAAGYREKTDSNGNIFRQYGDGSYETVDAQSGRTGPVPKRAYPRMDKLWQNEGPISVDNFTGFNHQRDGLPPMEDVIAEISGLRSLAQQEMGADDVMFGELMSFSLNERMATTSGPQRLQAIHQHAVAASKLPRALVGDSAIQLTQAMDVRSAEGNLQGLFDDVDKIIEAGQDPLVRDQEFAEYMKEYGPTIEAGPQELVDQGRGVIQPRKEDVFRIGEDLDPLSEERQLLDEQILMEAEALDRARGREFGLSGLEDPLFPQLMRAESTYRLTPEQESLLEGYKSEHRELLPTSPGVSREDLMATMSQEEKTRLKQLESLISKYERMKTEPRERVETGPLEAAEAEEGAARFGAYEEMRDQAASALPSRATPAATLLSIPYLTRMDEDGKVQPGRIEELKAAIESIELGDPKTAKQSAESAKQILLEQFEVSEAVLAEAQQEYAAARQKAIDAEESVRGYVLPGGKRVYIPKPTNRAESLKSIQALMNASEQRVQEAPDLVDAAQDRAEAAKKKAEDAIKVLEAINSDIEKLDAYVSEFAGPQERLVSDLPAHLRNRELIGKIKGQNPDLMEVPDKELFEALLGEKQKMVSEGKTIEGLWKEINP